MQKEIIGLTTAEGKFRVVREIMEDGNTVFLCEDENGDVALVKPYQIYTVESEDVSSTMEKFTKQMAEVLQNYLVQIEKNSDDRMDELKSFVTDLLENNTPKSDPEIN